MVEWCEGCVGSIRLVDLQRPNSQLFDKQGKGWGICQRVPGIAKGDLEKLRYISVWTKRRRIHWTNMTRNESGPWNSHSLDEHGNIYTNYSWIPENIHWQMNIEDLHIKWGLYLLGTMGSFAPFHSSTKHIVIRLGNERITLPLPQGNNIGYDNLAYAKNSAFKILTSGSRGRQNQIN